MNQPATNHRVGIVGAGFIARGLIMALDQYPGLEVTTVLTRRDPTTLGTDMPISLDKVTNNVEHLVKNSDLVVECTGDVIHGTTIIEQVLAADLPVVTMNSELQLVSGTMLARQGTLVEAEGDQPGSLAALKSDVEAMGFTPLVYGNVKRFLNLNPTEEEMEYWSKRQGISLNQVTSFTDGTKVQIEQALVANGLNATIACRNLSGIACTALEDGAQRLGELADSIGQPISDYILSPTAPAGVFIVGKHSGKQQKYLEYLKLGKGPYYVITRPYHLCHLEIPKTIENILSGRGSYTFNNGQHPTTQVYAVPKEDISSGQWVQRSLGSFHIRGEAAKIEDYPQGVPVGLLQEATFKRPVPAGQIITFDDVELPETRALQLWRQTVDEVIGVPSDPADSDTLVTLPAKPTVTVGIPAHNEEQNIVQALRSIVNQETNHFTLEKVIVLCDGSTDNTEAKARDFARHYPIIDVVSSSERLGKAARLNQLKQVNTSDIVVNFDADVVLSDRQVLQKMVDQFNDISVGLVAGNYQPVAAHGLIGRTIRTAEQLWYHVRQGHQNGQNIHNSAGCALAMTNDFSSAWQYPAGLVADQDFAYLKALQHGKQFKFVEPAVVWYQTPTSIKGWLLQASRSLQEKQQVIEYFFAPSAQAAYRIPLTQKARGVLKSFLRAPITTPLALLLQAWLRASLISQQGFTPDERWEMITSTKKIVV